uniref:Uncharacterized protein n=1 Tax=Cannabis sativa TaxID=3483 RepID=A0A803P8L9_CANSA
MITKKTQPTIICNPEKSRSEYCELETDVGIVGKTYSVFFVKPSSQVAETDTNINSTSSLWSVRPYARKDDATAMGSVKKWSISAVENQEDVPECTIKHSVPALLFSLGGYVGNNFHEFTDVVIPLFITSRKFNGEVQFLVSDKRLYFIEKYKKVLRALSNYDVIDINEILPIGGFEWIATNDFGVPAKTMNLKYLEYKIKNEESTLIKDYPLEHAVFTDPFSIGKQGWNAFKSIYLERQSVNLDVNRFKATLVEALHLLRIIYT